MSGSHPLQVALGPLTSNVVSESTSTLRLELGTSVSTDTANFIAMKLQMCLSIHFPAREPNGVTSSAFCQAQNSDAYFKVHSLASTKACSGSAFHFSAISSSRGSSRLGAERSAWMESKTCIWTWNESDTRLETQGTYSSDLKCWTPLVLQNVEADATYNRHNELESDFDLLNVFCNLSSSYF